MSYDKLVLATHKWRHQMVTATVVEPGTKKKYSVLSIKTNAAKKVMTTIKVVKPKAPKEGLK